MVLNDAVSPGGSGFGSPTQPSVVYTWRAEFQNVHCPNSDFEESEPSAGSEMVIGVAKPETVTSEPPEANSSRAEPVPLLTAPECGSKVM